MKHQSKFPHYSQTRKRLMILVFMVLGFGVFATVLVKYIGYFLVGTDCTLDKMISGYFIGLIPTALVMVVYEAVYFFHSWKEKVIEAETLARSQLVSQLEALKSQLDPHFLFNSLNTLSSLIDENEEAQQYLNRLADVYRYVLASKNRDTVTLREEMEFVDAFLYLAQVRFRTGLEVRKTIPDASWDKKVVPLGVQLLVENALKHNAITQHEPLAIDIEIEGDYLWVKNEIRPKVHLESSTKLGLKNILERYKLLTSRPVHIFNNRVRFEVALPLIV
jgi:LytS/YehU family sensor histidine kinase